MIRTPAPTGGLFAARTNPPGFLRGGFLILNHERTIVMTDEASRSDDASGVRFNGLIKAKCFPHWHDLIRTAAHRWGMHPSEYIRFALADRLASDGFDLAPPPNRAADQRAA
jgi:hypothetical protein